MKLKPLFAIVPLMLLLCTVLIVWRQQSKLRPFAQSPEKTMSPIPATALYQLFESNKNLALDTYLNKMVWVSGQVDDVMEGANGVKVVLHTGSEQGRVVCEVEPTHNENILNLEKGQEIHCWGICTGYLTDVDLNHCVIIQK